MALPLSLSGFLIFLSFLLGVFIGSFGVSPLFIGVSFFIGALIFVLGLTGRTFALILGLAVLLFTLGLWRMTSALQPDAKISALEGHTYQFNGIVESIDQISGANIHISVRTSELAGSETLISVITRRFPELHRGDEIVVSGKIEPVPADQEALFKRRGIRIEMAFPKITPNDHQAFSFLMALEKVKGAFVRGITKIMPEPDASFILGILIGERSTLGQDMKDAFAKTGTSHIVALSGYNITIVALAIAWLLGGLHLSARWRLIISACTIAIFVLLVGGGASVVRAAVMGVLALIARERGRIYEMTNALVAAAVIMVFINPYLLRFDLSFQLSFLATLGIILPQKLERWLQWIPEKGEFRQIISATIAAEIFVYPLIVFYFGRVSLIGPLANLLVLPFIPATMLLGFIVGVLGIVFSPLGFLFGWVLHIFLSYELGVITSFSRLPGASVTLPQFFAWILSLPPLIITFFYIYQRLHRVRLAR